MELTPYVPRLVLEWGRDTPDARYRRLGGTLAFCDLSGFTAMSEKLAALGRLGAEELADVLNLLFSELLADAAAYGGSLLKYGGDAVLLFFSGDDHEARGAAATHRMRATLRRVGTVKTSKGTVRVRMSVGIHSGEFDFFLVGHTHRELIVTGSGATTTVDMEGAAEAGEILLSPATAAALAPGCVGEGKGGGFLLKRIPRTEAKDPLAWGLVPDIDPVPFIPVGLRDHVGGVGADAEHRHIAVGFVAFGGVDDLLVTEGGERTAGVLDGFISECQAAFARYDACFLYADVYGDGGKVFFIVGAPVSHEDNEERALRAALEISSEHHHGLHLHTGLNRGYVFAGDIGAQFRRTYTVLGDAVNTAARVMASCNEDNQVRTMPEVLDLASSRFEAEPQAPFAAKGKALPLETFAVGAPLGPRLSDTPLPLVGRDAEMTELGNRLKATKEGRGGFLRIVGPAGIGKSRLVDEMVQTAEADGFATLTTFAERYEQTTVWFVLRQLLSVVFDDAHANVTELLIRALALAPTEARWFPLLGPVFGFEIEPTKESKSVDAEAQPTMLGRLTLKLLDGFLDGPSLWIAENGHLVDEASAKAIAAVTADLGQRPWLVVGVGRDDEAGGLGELDSDDVVVGPLSAEASTELARTADPTILPTDATRVANRSDGNPMFLRQLVSAHADGAELADSVETAIAARIDRLSATDRDVLRTASVLGGRADIGALRELVDGRTIDLAPLQDFLQVADGSFVFRQALYREVAYEGLTFRRRRMLHLAAGRLLEADGAAESGSAIPRLSLHFHNAQSWNESLRYSAQAAEAAYTTAAKAVAAMFFQRALDAARHLPDVSDETRAKTASDLGRALFYAGRVAEARAAYRIGRRYAPKQSLVRALLELREGVSWYGSGDLKRATPWFRRGIASLEASGMDPHTPEAAEVGVPLLAGLGDIWLRTGRVNDAEDIAQRVAEIADAAGEDDLRGVAHSFRARLFVTVGDIKQAQNAARLALDAFRDSKYQGTMAIQAMNLGAMYQMTGDLIEAEELLREALDAHVLFGMDMMTAATEINLAEVLVDQGRWEEAREYIARSLPVLAQADEESAAVATAIAARLAARTGRLDEIGDLPEPRIAMMLEEVLAGVRLETALAAADFTSAREQLASASEGGADILYSNAYRAALDPTREGIEAALAAARDQDDRLSAVFIRCLAGGELVDDADAKALGVVDVPVWARPRSG